MSGIKRLFVEKKRGFDVEAQAIFHDLKTNLGIIRLEKLRLLNRYDLSGISDKEYRLIKRTILSEPPVDHIYEDSIHTGSDEVIFGIEYLPGQYDQRADSAAQCIQIITRKRKPLVSSAKIFILKGKISLKDVDRIKTYLINPVDSRESSLSMPDE